MDKRKPTNPPPKPDKGAPLPEKVGGNPAPEERADFVVRRLEQFIRDGRTMAEGMPLSKWQEMARVEIANAIVESEVDNQDDDQVTKRLLFTVGSGFSTIGFWGALWAYEKVDYLISAFVCGLSGFIMLAIALEWRIRKLFKSHKANVRQKTVRRCGDLTKRIKKLEAELNKEAEKKEETLRDRIDVMNELLNVEVERRFGDRG